MHYLKASSTETEQLGSYKSMAVFDLFQASLLD